MTKRTCEERRTMIYKSLHNMNPTRERSSRTTSGTRLGTVVTQLCSFNNKQLSSSAHLTINNYQAPLI